MTSSWFFLSTPHILFIHTTRQFKMSFNWYYQVTYNIWMLSVTKVNTLLIKRISWSKMSLDSSGTQRVICKGGNLKKKKWSICRRNLFDILKATECLRTDLLWLWPIAARTLLLYDPAYWICVCCRRSGSTFQYPVLDGGAIRNRSIPPNVKMSSEY